MGDSDVEVSSEKVDSDGSKKAKELVEVKCTVYLKGETTNYIEKAGKYGYTLVSTLGAKALSTPICIERVIQVDINEELGKRTGAEKKALIVRALVAELQQEERLNVLVNLGVQRRKAVSTQRAKVIEAMKKLDESLEKQEITREVYNQLKAILSK